jgi:hypothetical protein
MRFPKGLVPATFLLALSAIAAGLFLAGVSERVGVSVCYRCGLRRTCYDTKLGGVRSRVWCIHTYTAIGRLVDGAVAPHEHEFVVVSNLAYYDGAALCLYPDPRWGVGGARAEVFEQIQDEDLKRFQRHWAELPARIRDEIVLCADDATAEARAMLLWDVCRDGSERSVVALRQRWADTVRPDTGDRPDLGSGGIVR